MKSMIRFCVLDCPDVPHADSQDDIVFPTAKAKYNRQKMRFRLQPYRTYIKVHRISGTKQRRRYIKTGKER